jgi:hypothetical protein
MRSGSTLIQELLTCPPYSFIFHEPKLFDNKFLTNRKHLGIFLKQGIDIHSMMKPPTLKKFKSKVFPLLQEHVQQIGVKEIVNNSWKHYINTFPDTKVILLGRDPRDLYVSVYYWKNKGRNKNKQILTARTTNMLRNQMKNQALIYKKTSAIKIKYEDVCMNNEESIAKIKDFIHSPIPTVGKVGGFLSSVGKRKNEFIKHGNSITLKSVGKWKKENKEIVNAAKIFFKSVPQYCKFWGYTK